MISGLWANTNLDDGKNTREQALIEIEEKFQSQLISVYNSDQQVEEIDLRSHPFFAAMDLESPIS